MVLSLTWKEPYFVIILDLRATTSDMVEYLVILLVECLFNFTIDCIRWILNPQVIAVSLLQNNPPKNI